MLAHLVSFEANQDIKSRRFDSSSIREVSFSSCCFFLGRASAAKASRKGFSFAYSRKLRERATFRLFFGSLFARAEAKARTSNPISAPRKLSTLFFLRPQQGSWNTAQLSRLLDTRGRSLKAPEAWSTGDTKCSEFVSFRIGFRRGSLSEELCGAGQEGSALLLRASEHRHCQSHGPEFHRVPAFPFFLGRGWCTAASPYLVVSISFLFLFFGKFFIPPTPFQTTRRQMVGSLWVADMNSQTPRFPGCQPPYTQKATGLGTRRSTWNLRKSILEESDFGKWSPRVGGSIFLCPFSNMELLPELIQSLSLEVRRAITEIIVNPWSRTGIVWCCLPFCDLKD